MAAGQMGRSSTFLTFGKAPVGAAMRLYAFAHAGGTASTYAQWSRLLTPEIEVVGIELPGHGTRLMEQPLSCVSEMVQEVVQALQRSVEGENPASPRPFALYGHSLGAIVAFETARLVAPDPRFALSHLFVGAARAPHLPRPTQAITHLSEDEFLVAVQQRYGGIPSAVLDEPELLEMILPARRLRRL
jgi:medium-chain acyl-[acyl-carrier-protein] hydrolase